MRNIKRDLLVMFTVIVTGLLVNGCGATQRAEEKAAAQCLGTEASQLAAIMEGSGSFLDKLGELTPDLVACAKAAQAAGSGSN